MRTGDGVLFGDGLSTDLLTGVVHAFVIRRDITAIDLHQNQPDVESGCSEGETKKYPLTGLQSQDDHRTHS